MVFFIIIVGLAVSIYFIKREKKIKITYSGKEGEFNIKGKKSDFIIVKNKRYVFRVKNGEIVSVADRKKWGKNVVYGGKHNGNN